MMDLIKQHEAERCYHSQNSTECPEQVWVCAIKDQTCKIRTDCECNAPCESRDSHVSSTHIFRSETRDKRLLEWLNHHFTDGNDDHCDHKEYKA